MAGTYWLQSKSASSHLSTKVSISRSVCFLTVRMSFTWEVLAACGPPPAMLSEMALLYSLQDRRYRMSHTLPLMMQQGRWEHARAGRDGIGQLRTVAMTMGRLAP